MTIPLLDGHSLYEFERAIVALIGQSALPRAEHMLRQAISELGSPDLRNVVDPSLSKCAIDGWDILCADLLEVDQRLKLQNGHGAELVQLSLVNRQVGDQMIQDLQLERRFFGSADLNEYGTPAEFGITAIDQSERLVRVTGLEDLMAIQRRRSPSGDSRAPAYLKWQIENVLSGLALIVRYHQVVDRYLQERGFPLAVAIIVQMDHAAWPMEQGINDFGPQARRLIERADHEPQPFDDTNRILAERTAERRSKFQAEVNRMIAEFRETYRILRMFPLYRFLARNKLAGLFNAQLRAACFARRMAGWNVGWRMSKRAFEGLLRRFAESMDPPSVEAALEPVHVDALHEHWLHLASASDFDLGSSPRSTFELNLAWALKFGGPIVQDRWEHAKPYRL